MTRMVEVTRSPFDLRSWQGLTAVLKAARESNLSPQEYAEFRNLVLEYAQKGGDVEIKKQIDGVIQNFSSPQKSEPNQKIEETHGGGTVSQGSHSFDRTQGRRITPVFKAATQTPQESIKEVVNQPLRVSVKSEMLPEAIVSIGREDEPLKISPEESEPEILPEIKVATELPATVVVPERKEFKTIEEHRLRITEIKRRVNAIVGNPVTLMDKGNGVGRSYMSALLTALKATSPGATMNLEDAMENLEKAFLEIISFNQTHVSSAPEIKIDSSVEVNTPAQENDVVQSVAADESELRPQLLIDTEEETSALLPPQSIDGAEEPEKVQDELSAIPETDVHTSESALSNTAPLLGDDRWNQDDQEDSKRDVREVKKILSDNQVPIRAVDRGRRALIPSLIDIEDEKTNDTRTEESAWHAHVVPDVVSQESLMRRPTSSISGLTVETPQTELMTSEITSALSQMLHEWNIFASSGLFGMGPGGIEHPLYEQVAHLAMGEVLSGRWNDANPKIVRAIKDYVDAWRHEQGVAYNPTETFEHYLRRVTQRILKRQKGEV